jgi:hypothetical protein
MTDSVRHLPSVICLSAVRCLTTDGKRDRGNTDRDQA